MPGSERLSSLSKSFSRRSLRCRCLRPRPFVLHLVQVILLDDPARVPRPLTPVSLRRWKNARSTTSTHPSGGIGQASKSWAKGSEPAPAPRLGPDQGSGPLEWRQDMLVQSDGPSFPGSPFSFSRSRSVSRSGASRSASLAYADLHSSNAARAASQARSTEA